ncbi:ribonuclease H protein [Pyrus ussuriensis x Pyrus communis]|uniref:Ribonuclease H protein n=1 Tax=Pyrus ussuriensis x Pyrus communis TaxID=2448454 RepID=A0A5N5F4Q1_9ROSA|nr:ribonuclease H protein [Pyrus ussuriensis x Pyrus communis]
MRGPLVACAERGYGRVQIETDSKVFVEMLNGLLLPEARLEGVLWDIDHTKQQLHSVDFLFFHRACNGAAHLIMNYVTCMGDSHLWDCFEPEWLFNTLAIGVNLSIRT